MGTHVAIVGTAESLTQAPFGDGSIEIWAVPAVLSRPGVTRVTRIFELHGKPVVDHYLNAMTASGAAIMLQDRRDDIPNSERYPIEDVTRMFGSYLTNSISYMMAYAMLVCVDRIDLYGIKMSYTTEYAEQRPSCEYFIGLARGKGIEVSVHQDSDLLKASYLYGYGSPSPVRAVIAGRIRKYQDNLEKLQAELDRVSNSIEQHRGALTAAKYFLQALD